MAAVSLTTLVARVRERADMPVAGFIADSATGLYGFINEGVQKLHEKLVDAMGEEYVSASTTFTTAAATSDYALPTSGGGFLKLYGVDLDVGGVIRTLRPYMRAERNAYRDDQLGLGRIPRYLLTGGYLRLLPIPAAGLTGTIWYAPGIALLTTGADTVNFPNGLERYVVLYAAIQALLKEESSVTGLMQMLEKEEAEIEKFKQMRDLAHPKQVVDMDVVDYEWLY